MLLEELVLHIKKQLIASGVSNFTIADGKIHFMNAGDKARGEEIMFEYLYQLLAERATIYN
ncbi:hypothetical protein [Sporomusa termitida]|uniref:Uncharacterized protein n=1 Tax=Sporomusa termitida TaxID=2377 RepID=A0A517DRK6_9FIRM|nr:hypothetical protein [Sporomusa termitida]QDR79995.1 hypothetical protein SPTER_13040 [Sporomusa termitida]